MHGDVGRAERAAEVGGAVAGAVVAEAEVAAQAGHHNRAHVDGIAGTAGCWSVHT